MANVAEYNEIKASILKGKVAPIYLLHGEEAYYIDGLSRFIQENVIEEHERDFNLTVLYGRDVDSKTLLETVKRYPMMAARQVVVLREAQDFDGDWTEVESYIENPLPTTVLVIDYKHKKADARKRWVTLIKQKGVVFTSDKVYQDKVPAIVKELAKSIKMMIHPEAAHLMAEYLGTDIEKIEGELKKLAIKFPSSKEVSVQNVKDNIGISKDFNQFEYVDAISLKKAERSYYLAYQLGRNEASVPMPVIVAALFGHFSKLMMFHGLKDKSMSNAMKTVPGMGTPFFAKKVMDSAAYFDQRKTALIIEKIREVDARFKGVNSVAISSQELLKELTFFILN